ncbi:MAG: hypothetical protein IT526_05375 [Nitrosomonas sp.]|uniref:hypothetical protein n=1 Tax=Nitrosomonas sp. TaxID=42353 RepID=UPI00256E271E|nr:hypothetical protein [Nitrosomonas sp.]MBE7527983.1 hypothetical protein [Burkholderiales bacterium]MCC6161666.1 hypothetical protein [Nitrosomonas sp.]MDL1865976.1 hypothetical protein [Betaproteobacteria bacterium PRO4]
MTTKDHDIYERAIENNADKLVASQSVLGEPEPWESWETSLCLWSIGIGIAALIILGILVDLFLLPG